ncbi:hypothetical protein N7520_008218 [Penicillium odoratum]|uniref:uncharacterized protein n=1 Tax=Penicillium odoratum TaxID=1167516 RepID=UPI0025474A3A|nr:uncharacterized protein N7520_008218 [Penicillium odoratum]KAJ5761062.1 hypothetical protein N7520_008218 [Penicillium odoratum]
MRDIPGFYYDSEKKKYFAIQANHVATSGASSGASASYSNESVKKRKIEHEKTKQKAEVEQRIAKEQIRRAAILDHPLFPAMRELGKVHIGSSLKNQVARGFASQLERRKLYKFGSLDDISVYVNNVFRDSVTGALIAGGQRGSQSALTITYPTVRMNEEEHLYDPEKERLLASRPYRLSSMCLSPANHMLVTMDDGPTGDAFLEPWRIPEEISLGDEYMATTYAAAPEIPLRATLFSSAAGPQTEKATFAIGTSRGLYTLEGAGDRWTITNRPFPIGGRPRKPNRADTCITTVDWLSPNVIVAGQRDSEIFSFDLRSGKSTKELLFTRPVLKLRTVDEHRIVVAGKEFLEIYDLRYTAKERQRNPAHHAWPRIAPRPYHTFSDYSPRSMPVFDLDPELGLLASASPDKRVQLFSTRTGTLVESPLAYKKYKHEVDCVRFEENVGTGLPSLLVCANGSLNEWKW